MQTNQQRMGSTACTYRKYQLKGEPVFIGQSGLKYLWMSAIVRTIGYKLRASTALVADYLIGAEKFRTNLAQTGSFMVTS